MAKIGGMESYRIKLSSCKATKNSQFIGLLQYYANSAGTGQKLFSKDEVIQYVKVHSTLHCQAQPTKRSMAIKRHSRNNQLWEIVEDANEHPDWLPHGWIVKFKTRNSGQRRGEIYKCYVEPSTGFKFYSKPEVFRYLKTVKQNCAQWRIYQLGGLRNSRLESNADRIRRDPYYMDPVTGYVFRSKKEVQCYLETGEISRHAFLPEERDPSPAAKRPKLEHAATKQQLNAEELNDAAKRSPKDYVNVNGTVFKENSNTTCSEPSEQKVCSSSQCKEDAANNRVVLIPDADIVLQHNSLENRMKVKTKNTLSKSTNKKGLNMPLRISKRLAGGEPQLVTSPVLGALAKTLLLVPTSVNPDEKHMEKNVTDNGAGSNENSNDKKGLCLPLQSSKRLAGPEPELVACSTVVLPEKCLKQNVIDNCVESKEHCNDKKFMHLALRSSKRLAGLEPELVATSASSEQAEAEPELVTRSLVETRLKPNVTNNGSEFKENSNDKKGLCLSLWSSKRLAGLEPELVANLPSTVHAQITTQAPTTLIPAEKCPKFNGAESRENKASESEAELPKAKVLKRNQDKEFSADNILTLTPEVGIKQMLNCHESGMKRRGKMKTWSSSSKSGCKKQVKSALQYSKRLAGLESECVANSESSEQALQNGIMSGKREPIPAIKATMADEVSELHEAECKTSHPCHAPHVNNSFDKETSNKSQKSLDDQAVPKEKSQELETDNPLMNIIEKSNNEKTSIYWRKSKPRKELNLPCRSSKRLSELQPQPILSSITNDHALHVGVRKSNKTKAIIGVGVVPYSMADRAAQQVKAGPEVQHAHYCSADVTATLHEESSENRKEPLDDHTVTKAKSENLDTEKLNNEKPEPQVSFSFGDFWSDPCLEFAFKTLTGAIPIDHYLPIQNYFQQQVNASQTLRNGNLQHQVDPSQTQKDVSLTLPDLGLPSFDISGHFDNPEKQSESQPQRPLNSCSFLPSGIVTLPSCSSITFQQPQWEGNKSLN
ncbi:unnamed protein product [Dovyalis caffra]|uniref:MBD domain-containing protein n=1 Tax=Dovyalis caffra TaxID=77055 RepID=A0AAV1RFF5_9ROSI|nr:unnamed protein product [Dovyalis caffra]